MESEVALYRLSASFGSRSMAKAAATAAGETRPGQVEVSCRTPAYAVARVANCCLKGKYVQLVKA